MVGPLPRPCVCGSFSASGCPLYNSNSWYIVRFNQRWQINKICHLVLGSSSNVGVCLVAIFFPFLLTYAWDHSSLSMFVFSLPYASAGNQHELFSIRDCSLLRHQKFVYPFDPHNLWRSYCRESNSHIAPTNPSTRSLLPNGDSSYLERPPHNPIFMQSLIKTITL